MTRMRKPTSPKTLNNQRNPCSAPCRALFLHHKTDAPHRRNIRPVCQKSRRIRHSNSPSADCQSKIGDMCGDFRAFPQEKLPYARARPGAERPVTECNTQKSGQSHFFDTLSGRSPIGGPSAFLHSLTSPASAASLQEPWPAAGRPGRRTHTCRCRPAGGGSPRPG